MYGLCNTKKKCGNSLRLMSCYNYQKTLHLCKFWKITMETFLMFFHLSSLTEGTIIKTCKKVANFYQIAALNQTVSINEFVYWFCCHNFGMVTKLKGPKFGFIRNLGSTLGKIHRLSLLDVLDLNLYFLFAQVFKIVLK